MTREDYLKKRNGLLAKAQACLDNHDTDGAVKCTAEIEQLDSKFEAFAKAQANINTLKTSGGIIDFNNLGVNVEGGAVGETFHSNGKKDNDTYEHAFMNFVCRSVPIPSKFKNEGTGGETGTTQPAPVTASGLTTTSGTSAVIPTTLLKEIIRELKTSGSIYSQIRKLNVQGGINVPILSLVPTASWIGESEAADNSEIKANTNISFSYYGLECKISQTLLANVVDLAEFNEMFVSLAVEAIVRTLEKGVFNGTGSSQMLGITQDTRVPAANIITLTTSEAGTWNGWKKKVFAKIKKAYQNGKFFMAEGTFQGEIDGMVDTTGQPVARVNYGVAGGGVYMFGGKQIETVEDDIIAPFDTAAENDVIAVFVDLKNYALNSNMQMRTVQWEDHDTHEIKTSVMLICDGKLIDPNGVLVIKKGK